MALKACSSRGVKVAAAVVLLSVGKVGAFNSTPFAGAGLQAARSVSFDGRSSRSNGVGTSRSSSISSSGGRDNGARGPSMLFGLFGGGPKAEEVLANPKWPAEWPYSPNDFQRADESPDAFFYNSPRLVFHIDDPAVGAVTKFYKENFPAGAAVLDICSSWVSHFPKDGPWAENYGRRSGLGMNRQELSKNPQLDDYVVRDLNADPTFPYEDNSFDIITCVVSIDYLNKPKELMLEMARVLKPGGKVIISMSNRCFPTKVWQLWSKTSDMDHIFIVGSFFHYSGKFKPAKAHDVSPNPGRSDPMYIVEATVDK